MAVNDPAMLRYLFTIAAIATLAAPAIGAVAIGQPAPAFAATDSNGKTVQLSDFRGKRVVLEWTNPECPFVEAHYSSGNMQRQQRDARQNGTIWLTINSTAKGKAGNLDAAAANAGMRSEGARPHAYLLDTDGKIGRAYDAGFTPQMFVIAADGKLAYAGGIDDVPSANPADIAKADQLVSKALSQLREGKEVRKSTSRPYGCSIK